MSGINSVITIGVKSIIGRVLPNMAFSGLPPTPKIYHKTSCFVSVVVISWGLLGAAGYANLAQADGINMTSCLGINTNWRCRLCLGRAPSSVVHFKFCG